MLLVLVVAAIGLLRHVAGARHLGPDLRDLPQPHPRRGHVGRRRSRSGSACFVLTYTFPLLNKGLGPAGTFWTLRRDLRPRLRLHQVPRAARPRARRWSRSSGSSSAGSRRETIDERSGIRRRPERDAAGRRAPAGPPQAPLPRGTGRLAQALQEILQVRRAGPRRWASSPASPISCSVRPRKRKPSNSSIQALKDIAPRGIAARPGPDPLLPQLPGLRRRRSGRASSLSSSCPSSTRSSTAASWASSSP